MRTNRSASGTGSGFSSTEWTIAKTTVFTLRQAASVISAVSVKPRSLDRTRTPKRMLRSTESMMLPATKFWWGCLRAAALSELRTAKPEREKGFGKNRTRQSAHLTYETAVDHEQYHPEIGHSP